MSALAASLPQMTNEVARNVKMMDTFGQFGDHEGQMQCIRKLGEIGSQSDASTQIVLKAGGLYRVCNFLNHGQQRCKIVAALALDGMAKHASSRVFVVSETKAIRYLNAMLRTDDRPLQSMAAQCLATLLQDENVRLSESVQDSGVLESLTELAHSQIIGAFLSIASSINSFSKTTSLQKAVVDSGGIEALIAMSDASPQIDLHLKVAECFGTLSRVTKYGDMITACGGVPIIVSALQHHIPEVTYNCLLTLSNMKSGMAYRKLHANPLAFELIAEAARTSEPRTSAMAVKILMRATEHKEIVMQLVKVGVLDLLLENYDPKDLPSSKMLVNGLAHLLEEERVQDMFVNDPQLLGIIYQLGYMSSVEVCEWAAYCLYKLAEQEKHHIVLVEDERRRTLLLKYAQRDDVKVRRHAARVLSRLAQNPAASVYLANPRCTGVLVGLTKSHDEEILRHGAIAVASLEYGTAGSGTIDAESGLLILVQFGSAPNTSMQIQAARALSSIALNFTSHQHFEKLGVLQFLDKLSENSNPDVRAAGNLALRNFRATEELRHNAIYATIRSADACTPVPMSVILELLDSIRHSEDPNVLVVGLAALASLNLNEANASRFFRAGGVKAMERFVKSGYRVNGPVGITEEIVGNAVKVLTNYVIDEASAKFTLQVDAMISHMVQLLSIRLTREAEEIKFAVCKALRIHALHSKEVRDAILKEQALWPLVLLLNSKNVQLQIASAGSLSSLASDPQACTLIMKEDPIPGITQLLKNTLPAALEHAMSLLSSLSVAEINQLEIMKHVKWSDIVAMCKNSEKIVRVPTLKFVGKLIVHSTHGFRFRIQALDNHILAPVIRMVDAVSDEETESALTTLVTLAGSMEVRERLKGTQIFSSLDRIAGSFKAEIKMLAAELLIRLVDIDEVTVESVIPSQGFDAAIKLMSAGDAKYPVQVACAIDKLLKIWYAKVEFVRLRGIHAALSMARSAKVDAQRVGLSILLKLSDVPKFQVEIARAKSMQLVLGMADRLRDVELKAGLPRYPDIEALALRLLCNLSLDEGTHKYFDRAGARSLLQEWSQGYPDLQLTIDQVETKARVSQITISHLNAKPALKPLDSYEVGIFSRALKAGDVPNILELLNSHRNLVVQREIATKLANLATDVPEIELIVTDGGVVALVQLLASDDAVLKCEAARACGNIAVYEPALDELMRNNTMEHLCRVLTEIPIPQQHPSTLLETLHAMTNILRLDRAGQLNAVVIRDGGFHGVLSLVRYDGSGDERTDKRVRRQAKSVLKELDSNGDQEQSSIMWKQVAM